jgi:mono/diheme cytochrome c family protein
MVLRSMRGRPIAIAAVLVLLGLGAVALVYREAIAHGFSAREKPWAIEAFAARHLRKLATGTESAQLQNPYVASPDLLSGAREHFADHCALCHAVDGSGKTEIGEGLYPPAPDLRDPNTQELSDGELFAIIRNGIRFTGMPGWGGKEGEDTDDEIWQLVVFVRHLPDLSDEELQLMREIHSEERSDGHEQRHAH